VMRFNLPHATGKMATIGQVILNRRLGSDQETAKGGIQRLEEFFASFHVAHKLHQEIEEDQKSALEQICNMAVNDACNLTNPRPASSRELLEICREVW